MQKKIKILVAYHRPEKLFKDDVLTPIHVGRALALKSSQKDRNLSWMLENMIGDDTGDNISDKNASYNEMTAIYWAWKNYNELGNPDYLGFMHYRRHFIYRQEEQSCVICNKVEDSYLDDLNYSRETISSLLDDSDFICPKPFYRKTVYEHYKQNHRIEDLDIVIDIINDKYPDYKNASNTYLNGYNAFFFNMFIFPKEIFFDYAEWIFGILSEFEKRTDIKGKRLFISERLTGIYITRLLEKNFKGKYLSTMYIEGPHTIPVIFSTDEKYADVTSVTMTSILENAKENTFYDFYLLIPSKFEQSKIRNIDKIKDKYVNCNITYIDMKDNFSDANLVGAHITMPTYYRLMAAKLLPNHNKCIYLDSDIIVNDDLTDFYNINIDDFCVAGVKAPAYHFHADGNQKYCKKVGLESINQYINAGVLLLNLKAIREKNLTEEFIRMSRMDLPSQDQDVINKVCYNDIKHIPFKFNNMMSKYPNDHNRLKKLFNAEEVEEAIRNPVIIHYCDKIKPWQDPTCLFADYWWKYAVLSPYGKRYASEITKFIKIGDENNRVKKELSELRISYNNIQNSVSFKIGRMVTLFPRKLRAGIRCFKEHGFCYTLRRGKEKILRRKTK